MDCDPGIHIPCQGWTNAISCQLSGMDWQNITAMVERRRCKRQVVGSNPTVVIFVFTLFCFFYSRFLFHRPIRPRASKYIWTGGVADSPMNQSGILDDILIRPIRPTNITL